MPSRLEDLRLLAAVVEHGSFTAAAAHTGASQPRVSRAVARLEEHLGRVLIRRSPRRVAATETGLRYAAVGRRLVATLTQAEAELRSDGGLAGPLSLSTPPAVGRRVLLPAVARFCAEHPDVVLDWSLGARRVDLIADSVDVAVRFGPLPDTWERSRRLLLGGYHLYAAPGVADHRVFPRELDQVATLGLHVTHLRDRWPFREGSEVRWVPVRPALWADDVDALIQLAVAGLGVTMLPDFLVSAEVADGRLVRRTEDSVAVPADVFVMTGAQASTSRAAALVECLIS